MAEEVSGFGSWLPHLIRFTRKQKRQRAPPPPLPSSVGKCSEELIAETRPAADPQLRRSNRPFHAVSILKIHPYYYGVYISICVALVAFRGRNDGILTRIAQPLRTDWLSFVS